MHIHLISGFLGSGKTTAIQTACNILKAADTQVAVITNDQGSMLVDTGYFESNAIPNRQVINGCFCCNYNALDENINALIQSARPAVIFAESVGSCTDIVATVMKPLLRFKNDVSVTVSTFADIRLLHMLFIEQKELFSPEVRYIYEKQLEEAQTIVISKVDLAQRALYDAVHAFFQAQYPEKKLVYINGNDTGSTKKWLDAITSQGTATSLPSLDIDYDIYGAGEANLAWLDEVFEIYDGKANAIEDAVYFIDDIYKQLKQNKLAIGHLKVLINQELKLSYTEIQEPQISKSLPQSVRAEVILNARVQTDPQTLSRIVSTAVQSLQDKQKCIVDIIDSNAFVPGYPRPTHRVTA